MWVEVVVMMLLLLLVVMVVLVVVVGRKGGDAPVAPAQAGYAGCFSCKANELQWAEVVRAQARG